MTYSRVVNTFLQLVQVDSPTGFENDLAKDLVDRLLEMGYEPEIDAVGNVVLQVEGDASYEPLFLSAHMDTVEPGRGIQPTISNGVISSINGTVLGADNKTAVAALLETLERLSESDVPHPTLEVVFTVSEESGNHGAHGLDYSRLRSKKGYISDASGQRFGDLIIASPYYVRFDARILGKPAHASLPQEAVNALSVFSEAYQLLSVGKVSQHTTVNVGMVQCGEVVNTVPGEVMFSGEVRSMKEEELEEVVGKVGSTITDTALRQGASAHLTTVRENGGFLYEKNDPFVCQTEKFLRQMGHTPTLVESWGCYDANVFSEHGLQVLNVADGSQNAHTADEQVSIRNLDNLADLFYRLITN